MTGRRNRFLFIALALMLTAGGLLAPGRPAIAQSDEIDTDPLFRIEPGIPCRDAREQSSELMGYVRELTITGLMDEKPMMIWAAYYLSAMAKALMDDAELGMKQ